MKHISNNVLLLISFIFIICIIILINGIYKIYKKFNGQMKPNHIFMLNLLITFTLKCCYLIFIYNHTMWMSSGTFELCLHYFVGLVIFISTNIDIIIMQADRFIAVFWSLQYPGFATNGRAVLICIISKLVNIVISSLVLFFDKDYLRCSKTIPLLITKTSSIIMISCLQLFVTVIVGIVSSYLGFKMVQIKKSENRVVNVSGVRSDEPCPQNEQEMVNVKGQRIQVRRIDDEPNMFYSIEINAHEAIEMSNPPQDLEAESTAADCNNTNIFLMARTALNMNYIVILHCLINTPLSIMSIIYWDCSQERGECDAFLLFTNIMIIPRFFVIFCGFCIFFFNFKKLDSDT
jgi:hypothetical protein